MGYGSSASSSLAGRAVIELPERADLLVAEVIGNEPLEEEILETMLDARHRLLKPGARMIPHALTPLVCTPDLAA